MINQSDPLVQAAYQQMQQLHDAAALASQNSDIQRSADFLRQALEFAESVNDQRYIYYYRAFLAFTVNQLGRLKESLTVLSPILQQTPSHENADVFCAALFSYIDVALDLPVQLSTISKVLSQAEQFIQDVGKPEWRAKYLFKLSGLYLAQGLVKEAYSAAQESWAVYKEGYPQYLPGVHLHHLVTCSLANREPDQAERALEIYENHQTIEKMNHHDKMVALEVACRKSELARLRKDTTLAVDWARKAVLAVSFTDDAEDIQIAYRIGIRAELAAGHIERAWKLWLKLVPFRYAEEGYIRYNIRLLWGDLHLGTARHLAAMSPTDDEFFTDESIPKEVSDQLAIDQSLSRARRAYGAAFKMGAWLDQKYECSWRQQDVNNRLLRVEAIDQAMHSPA
ncbi:MAG: hypothetical protein AAGD25_22680 [Cyanobacteria bacterium P01_F01_bin.150]